MKYLNTPQSVCRMGAARGDITPPVGIYHSMWGAATHDRATGIHRPLTATVLAFQAARGPSTADTEQVLATIDLSLLWTPEMDALRASVCKATGLLPEQLLIAFSHTHAAGLMDRERVARPGGEMIGPYLDRLAATLADLVRDARRSMQLVTITYGTGHCGLAAHRDYWDETNRQFVCGFNPGGPSDDTVLVARMTDAQGRIVATMVNYACHPTTLAWQNTLISPDYPGAMRELVEGATGAPCAFLQGASGDLGPREGFVGEVAVADRNGRQLGHAVLAALEALPPPGTRFAYTGPVVSGASLGTWAHVPEDARARELHETWRLRRWTVPLAYRPELPTMAQTQAERRHWQQQLQAAQDAGDAHKVRDCRAMIERMDRRLTRIAHLPPGKAYPFSVALWQIGDAFWLAVEAEIYNVLQRTLRSACSPQPLVVATIVNSTQPTYLPPADIYGKGIYQESIAVIAAGGLEQLIEAIAGQLRAWRSG